MNEAEKVMPHFVFGRRRDIEVQPGAELMLAGFLVTPFRKGHILGETERRRISVVRVMSTVTSGWPSRSPPTQEPNRRNTGSLNVCRG